MKSMVVFTLTALLLVGPGIAQQNDAVERETKSQKLVRLDINSVFSSTSERIEFTKKLEDIQNSEDVCRNDLSYSHRSVHEEVEAVQKLSPGGLALIAKLMQQYKEDPAFVRHMGGLLTLDLEDADHGLIIPREVGGLGVLADDIIEVVPILSYGRVSLSHYKDHLGLNVTVMGPSNSTYHEPFWAIEQIPHVFEFHFHAVNKPKPDERCVPSFGSGNSKNGFAGDIGHALYHIERFGESHTFLFTILPDRTFGTIYYGGTKSIDGSITVSVVALPNQNY